MTQDEIENLALDGDLFAVQEIISQLHALRTDAERYRWLRAQHWSDNTLCVVMWPTDVLQLGSVCPYGDGLDGVIDKRRGKTDE